MSWYTAVNRMVHKQSFACLNQRCRFAPTPSYLDQMVNCRTQSMSRIQTALKQSLQYFPMFARLKPLVKLQYMAKCIANRLRGLKKSYCDEDVPTDDILLEIHKDNCKNIIEGLLETYRQSSRRLKRHDSTTRFQKICSINSLQMTKSLLK